MAIGLADPIRVLQALDILTAMDASGACKVELFNGTRPSKGGAITTMLAEVALNNPSCTQSNGVLTFIVSPALSDPSADAAGLATWCRIKSGAGTFVMDCDVGVGQIVTLDNYNISAGGIVNLTSGQFTVGNI